MASRSDMVSSLSGSTVLCPRFSGGFLEEHQPVPEWIGHSQFPSAPRRILQTRARETILRIRQPAMEIRQCVRPDPQRRARAAVPMMLAQVDHAVAERDLHIERQVVREAMLPVDAKAEEADV